MPLWWRSRCRRPFPHKTEDSRPKKKRLNAPDQEQEFESTPRVSHGHSAGHSDRRSELLISCHTYVPGTHDVYWYVFVVVLKVKKASLAQNTWLPAKKKTGTLLAKNRFESTPRVTHGPQRTRVTHDVEHAQKFDDKMCRPESYTHSYMPNP